MIIRVASRRRPRSGALYTAATVLPRGRRLIFQQISPKAHASGAATPDAIAPPSAAIYRAERICGLSGGRPPVENAMSLIERQAPFDLPAASPAASARAAAASAARRPDRPRRAAIAAAGFVLRLWCARGPLTLDEVWSIENLAPLRHFWQVFWGISHDNNHFLNSLWLYISIHGRARRSRAAGAVDRDGRLDDRDDGPARRAPQPCGGARRGGDDRALLFLRQL